MDESAVDDEKKPFEEGGGQDEDAQPDPDEHLMLDQGGGRVWLVKVNSVFLALFFARCPPLPPPPLPSVISLVFIIIIIMYIYIATPHRLFSSCF